MAKKKVKTKTKTKDVGFNKLTSKVTKTPTTRYDKLVQKVNNTTDIKALKKIIYNRNYRLKKAYLKEHPETLSLQYPSINDIRHIKGSTFKRLASMKDPQKVVEALRSLIIDNTRRRNVPKSVADYSNREKDYLANSIESLKAAVGSWGNSDGLRGKLEPALEEITLEDMNNIFSMIPSYWAISEGYYYAVVDFENFMNEIFSIIERPKLPNGQSKYKLSARDREIMKDRFFRNDPRTINRE